MVELSNTMKNLPMPSSGKQRSLDTTTPILTDAGLKDLDNWLFNIEMCFRKFNIPDDRCMIELGGNFLVGKAFDLHRKHITNGLYNWDEFKMGLIGLVPISLEKELLSEFRNLCVSSTMSFEKFCDRFNYITRKVEISDSNKKISVRTRIIV
jgi:hypothetical protein